MKLKLERIEGSRKGARIRDKLAKEVLK